MRDAACVAVSLLAGMLAGCAAPRVLTSSPTVGECPSSLRTGIRLTASVAQVAIPDGIEAPSGPVRLIAGVGHRVLLSVEVPNGLPRVRLLENALAMFTYGGTLAGWARVVEPAGAGARESLQVCIYRGRCDSAVGLHGARTQWRPRAMEMLRRVGFPAGRSSFCAPESMDPAAPGARGIEACDARPLQPECRHVSDRVSRPGDGRRVCEMAGRDPCPASGPIRNRRDRSRKGYGFRACLGRSSRRARGRAVRQRLTRRGMKALPRALKFFKRPGAARAFFAGSSPSAERLRGSSCCSREPRTGAV